MGCAGVLRVRVCLIVRVRVCVIVCGCVVWKICQCYVLVGASQFLEMLVHVCQCVLSSVVDSR